MTESRLIIKVFLASPNDLTEERNAAYDAVHEINTTTAIPQGYQFELIRWEDVSSETGRPQDTINRRLEECELLIGILWQRWGSPPDQTGEFSSGFEEEFSYAEKRKNLDDEFDYKLFFKDVDQDKTIDPGVQLKQVLQFKEKIIQKGSIIFRKFANKEQFLRVLREDLAHHLNKKIKLNQRTQSQTSASTIRIDEPGRIESEASEHSKHRIKFLRSISSSLQAEDDAAAMTALDVARLRLVAATNRKNGNDDEIIEVHDANLIYRSKNELNLDDQEISLLADAGLRALATRNKPVWFWLSFSMKGSVDWLLYTTFSPNKLERLGAFKALILLSVDVHQSEFYSNVNLNALWYEHEDTETQLAAVNYWRELGDLADAHFLENQLSKKEGGQQKALIEALVAIYLRFEAAQAAHLITRQPFLELDNKLLAEAFTQFGHLSTEELNSCLKHPNARVRETALRFLMKRNCTEATVGWTLAEDIDLGVRTAALELIQKATGELKLSDVKNILVRPTQQRNALSIFAGLQSDYAGANAYEIERFRRLKRVLRTRVKNFASDIDADPELSYLANVDINFETLAPKLRLDFDAYLTNFENNAVRTFGLVSEKTEEKSNKQGLNSLLLPKATKSKSAQEDVFIRRATSILVSKSDPQDLNRIRSAIDADVYWDLSDFAYFAKHGNWSDIERLSRISSSPRYNPLSLTKISNNFMMEASKAMISIGKGRLSELLKLNLAQAFKVNLVLLAANKDFSDLSDVDLNRLLTSESDQLREIAALKCVVSFGPRRLKKILTAYHQFEKYYYNVVFWLDLGIGFPNKVARSIAYKIIQMEFQFQRAAWSAEP
jgi:hypothetical protein